jgi:hypothetical protein
MRCFSASFYPGIRNAPSPCNADAHAQINDGLMNGLRGEYRNSQSGTLNPVLVFTMWNDVIIYPAELRN